MPILSQGAHAVVLAFALAHLCSHALSTPFDPPPSLFPSQPLALSLLSPSQPPFFPTPPPFSSSSDSPRSFPSSPSRSQSGACARLWHACPFQPPLFVCSSPSLLCSPVSSFLPLTPLLDCPSFLPFLFYFSSLPSLLLPRFLVPPHPLLLVQVRARAVRLPFPSPPSPLLCFFLLPLPSLLLPRFLFSLFKKKHSRRNAQRATRKREVPTAAAIAAQKRFLR